MTIPRWSRAILPAMLAGLLLAGCGRSADSGESPPPSASSSPSAPSNPPATAEPSPSAPDRPSIAEQFLQRALPSHTNGRTERLP